MARILSDLPRGPGRLKRVAGGTAVLAIGVVIGVLILFVTGLVAIVGLRLTTQ